MKNKKELEFYQVSNNTMCSKPFMEGYRFEISRQLSPFGDPEAFWTVTYRFPGELYRGKYPTRIEVELDRYSSGTEDWERGKEICRNFLKGLTTKEISPEEIKSLTK